MLIMDGEAPLLAAVVGRRLEQLRLYVNGIELLGEDSLHFDFKIL